MDRQHFICPSVRHVGYFYLLAIVNKAAVNISVQIWDLLSIPLAVHSEMRLLNHRIILFLIFWGATILFSTEAALFYIGTNSVQAFPFATSLPTLTLFFDSSHPNGYEIISHCGFALHFSNDYWHWLSFIFLLMDTFLIPEIIHEPYFGMQLRYPEAIWSFQILLLWFVRWVQSKTCSRANCSLPLRQDLPGASTQFPVNDGVFHSG